MLPVSYVDLTAPTFTKRSQTLPPGKASARPQRGDSTFDVVPPLSEREQQVIDQRKDGVSFEEIAVRLGFSLAAAHEYHRRAIDKLKRSPELEIPSALSELLEQALAKPTKKKSAHPAVSEYRS